MVEVPSRRQVFAFSGMLSDERARARNVELTDHAIGLAPVMGRPVKLCLPRSGRRRHDCAHAGAAALNA